MVGKWIYALCAITSLLCAFLLLRGYRRNRTKLLFWSSICFAALAVDNIVLAIDLAVFPEVDFYGTLIRSFLKAFAGSVLLFGILRDLL